MLGCETQASRHERTFDPDHPESVSVAGTAPRPAEPAGLRESPIVRRPVAYGNLRAEGGPSLPIKVVKNESGGMMTVKEKKTTTGGGG